MTTQPTNENPRVQVLLNELRAAVEAQRPQHKKLGHRFPALARFNVKTRDVLNPIDGLFSALCNDAVRACPDVAALEQIFAWRLGHQLYAFGPEEEDYFLAGMLLVLDVLRQHPAAVQAAIAALYTRAAELAPKITVEAAQPR